MPQISVITTPSNIHPFPLFKLINLFIIGCYGMAVGHCPKDKVLVWFGPVFLNVCMWLISTWHFCTWTQHFPINIILKGKPWYFNSSIKSQPIPTELTVLESPWQGLLTNVKFVSPLMNEYVTKMNFWSFKYSPTIYTIMFSYFAFQHILKNGWVLTELLHKS